MYDRRPQLATRAKYRKLSFMLCDAILSGQGWFMSLSGKVTELGRSCCLSSCHQKNGVFISECSTDRPVTSKLVNIPKYLLSFFPVSGDLFTGVDNAYLTLETVSLTIRENCMKRFTNSEQRLPVMEIH